jgi:hypothetical protein
MAAPRPAAAPRPSQLALRLEPLRDGGDGEAYVASETLAMTSGSTSTDVK